ncbi:MAG: hypothetical protein AB7T49_06845 [Oligoflexales bacterium]
MKKITITLAFVLPFLATVGLAADATYFVPGDADPLFRTFSVTIANVGYDEATGHMKVSYNLPKYLDVSEKVVELEGHVEDISQEFTLTSTYGSGKCRLSQDATLSCEVDYGTLGTYTQTVNFLNESIADPFEREQRTLVLAAFDHDPIGVVTIHNAGIEF